ncbi:MAG: hypothetical protein WAT93_08530 [Pontixanthobacter sp.]
MAKPDNMAGFGKMGLVLGAAAAVALAVPSAVFALGGNAGSGVTAPSSEFAPFTPATVDAALARRVAENIRSKGLNVGFTPAGTGALRDKTVTVAIRVNDQTAQSLSVQKATALAQTSIGNGRVAIDPTRYNLGIARGYQGFAKTPSLPAGIRNLEMPDLADYQPSEGVKDKPSRFKTRIAVENEVNVGRSPRTIGGNGDQSFDLGGAYRVTKNLDVTAGVRLSQERERLDPLTDNVQDSQAVYVGTQFRF